MKNFDVSQYKIVSFISKGTYGSVYEGCDLKTNHKVAIKHIELSKIDPFRHMLYISREITILHNLTEIMNTQGIVNFDFSTKLLNILLPKQCNEDYHALDELVIVM